MEKFENKSFGTEEKPSFELSNKEKFLEFVALSICFMLLFGCFLKVIFF